MMARCLEPALHGGLPMDDIESVLKELGLEERRIGRLIYIIF